MRKIKMYIKPMIFFSILFGFLMPTFANAAEDLSGEWNGRWI